MNVIDLIALIPLAFFMISGFNKGIVKEIFGLIALVLGIIATLQFSHFVIVQVSSLRQSSSPLLPVFVYVLLFIGVFLIVIYIGRLIEKLLKISQLNFGNRLAGALLGVVKALFIVSFFVWLADMANFFDEKTKQESITYKYVKQFTPKAIEFIGALIPTLKELIANIEDYFRKIAETIDHTH